MNNEINLNPARTIKIGTMTLIAGIIANFIPVCYLWITYGAIPPFQDILKIWSLAIITFGVSWVIQPITFFTMLGTAGSYIGWLAGSVADIRCPAVTMAQKITGYEPGTPEGSVIATIGITGTIFVSVGMITFFTFIGANIVDILPPFIKESFKVILPAVFGAVYVELAKKQLKMGAATIGVAILLGFLAIKIGIPIWILNISVIASGIIIARVQYLSDRRKDGSNA